MIAVLEIEIGSHVDLLWEIKRGPREHNVLPLFACKVKVTKRKQGRERP